PDLPTAAYLFDLVVAVVFDGRKLCRKRTGTGGITCPWRLLSECLVGPDQVVLITPFVECQLTGLERMKACALQQLALECAMKALVLALGLRMIWPAVAGVNAKPDEPCFQPGNTV